MNFKECNATPLETWRTAHGAHLINNLQEGCQGDGEREKKKTEH